MNSSAHHKASVEDKVDEIMEKARLLEQRFWLSCVNDALPVEALIYIAARLSARVHALSAMAPNKTRSELVSAYANLFWLEYDAALLQLATQKAKEKSASGVKREKH
jgi:hypothetical protein